MFEASVDGFNGAVAGSGSVEVGELVSGAFLQGPSEGDHFGEQPDPGGQRPACRV